MWDYLFFMVYLRHKPATEYTGAETFLARCIEEESPEWIPVNRAIVLEDDATPEDTAQQQYDALQAALAQQSNAVEWSAFLDQLRQDAQIEDFIENLGQDLAPPSVSVGGVRAHQE